MLDGTKPHERNELPRIDERISFLYADYCKLEKEDSAIRLITEKGAIDVLAGEILVLMLGPGTTITHNYPCTYRSESARRLEKYRQEKLSLYLQG